jgi:hypothetical protein
VNAIDSEEDMYFAKVALGMRLCIDSIRPAAMTMWNAMISRCRKW